MVLTVRIAGGWFYRMRRVLATLCIGVLAIFIGYKVIFGANGMKVYEDKRAEAVRLQQQIDDEKRRTSNCSAGSIACNGKIPTPSRKKRANNWGTLSPARSYWSSRRPNLTQSAPHGS